jgi:hypothetical protein
MLERVTREHDDVDAFALDGFADLVQSRADVDDTLIQARGGVGPAPGLDAEMQVGEMQQPQHGVRHPPRLRSTSDKLGFPTRGGRMDVADLMSKAKDAVTVKRVFGEPVEKDGLIVIPVAAVLGGGGGGGDDSGGGGGFGLNARPVGVYVIRGDDVRFEPALDLTAIILGGQKIALLLVRLLFSLRKRRARKRR